MLGRVVQQAVDVNGAIVIGPPKTRHSERLVALDAATVDALAGLRADREAKLVTWGVEWSETSPVFTSVAGRPLRPEYVTRHFQRLAVDADLPVIRLHDLRHVSASLALSAGVPLKVVSDRLGHSSVSITADLYTHVMPATSRDAAEAVAAMVAVHEQELARSRGVRDEYAEGSEDDQRGGRPGHSPRS